MITHPLLNLPQHVLDAVISHLTPANLAVCGLVCQAWRNLPYEHLQPKLVVQAGPLATGILDAGLHRCRNLRTICVTSSKDPVWPCFAAALAQQQLASLRELHIQHSSQTDAAHLEQLRAILQVQGPQCVLHLALTDKASLQALLPMLPLRGLASLELNVPYLADGALQLLLHAASVQAAALCSISSSTHPSDQLLLQQWQPQQGVLRVGLWVCCWGGCPGLALADAQGLHSKLQQLSCCTMTGCESINLTTKGDLTGLSQLHGLEALGINFVSNRTQSVPTQQVLPRPAGVQEPGTAMDTDQPITNNDADTNKTADSSYGRAEVMRVLASLSNSLKQLSIRGSPPNGWGPTGDTPASTSPQKVQQRSQPQQAAVQQATLAALTGLTKLSLQKDWSKPALAVAPIAALTLLQELAIERHGLQRSGELACLSRLTGLRVLSLVLTVTADELIDAVQEGNWHLVGPAAGPAHWVQQQQQACAAVVEKLSSLHVEDSMGALMEWGTDDGAAVCSCCCSKGAVVDAGGTAEGAAGCCSRDAGLGVENLTDAVEVAAGVTELLQGVAACPVLSNAGCPMLLDWSWLRCLQQLETAWLQVPHLDLSCLPSSLVELDAQQPHDLTHVSITCRSSRGIGLPRLQRMVLPHLLQPTEQPPEGGLSMDPSSSMLAAGQGGDSGMQSDDSTQDDHSGDGSKDEGSPGLQGHYEAAILLSVARGCPELKELELVQWQPPSAAVLAAVQGLKRLKLLSLVEPEECAGQLQQQVQAVRTQHSLRAVGVQLAEPLVLSSYPWSSVLAMR